ncbi:MAG: hypothetical protein C4575_11300 [Desulforudis sp.]|jgi:hypothetical protein|nr:MAG: hypothetical protein C4575_11300 [Desulforudis sp.]
MPPEITVRYASPEDDAGIVALMSRLTMPGKIGLGYRYEPSFLSALSVEGDNPIVVVAEQGGEIRGVGSVLTREVFLNGEPAQVGYLSSLRLAPDIQGTSALARGFRLFREADETKLHVPFYLTSILADNHAAIKILTRQRAGLPRYRLLANYRTIIIPVMRRKRLPAGKKILHGECIDADIILQCLERYGKEKNFFSRFRLRDLLDSTGMMQGLRAADFLVALDGDEPIGVLGLWNQSAFKKLIIKQYSRGLRLLSTMLGAIGKSPLLPPENRPFSPVYLSCVAVKNNDQAIFRQLLQAAINTVYATETDSKVLIAGFFGDDRLAQVAMSFIHLSFQSNIYTVGWNDNFDLDNFKASPKYIDIGSL